MSTYALNTKIATPGRRLDGVVVLVTGAAAGIGGAVSRACAREGATVLLLDKSQKGLDAVYDDIVAEKSPDPVQIQEDMATLDMDRAAALESQIASSFGRLDAIIHAASEAAPLSPLEHYPVDTFGRVLHAQVTSPWILTRTLVPLLRSSGRGRIVFTSGRAGREPRAYHGATAVGWSGIDTLAGLFAEEFEHNESIRVFAVDPGAVNTATRTRWYPGEDRSALAAPDEVADAWVFLASNESAAFDGPLCEIRGKELASVDYTA